MKSALPLLRTLGVVVLLAAARSAAAGPVFSNDFETGTVCHWDDAFPTVYCWSNPAGGQWTNAANWKHGSVPPNSSNIDVGIDVDGLSGTVVVSAANPVVHNVVSHASIQMDGQLFEVAGKGIFDAGLSSVAGNLEALSSGDLTVTGATNLDGGSLGANSGGHVTLASLTTASDLSVSVGGPGGEVALPALTSLTSTAGHAPLMILQGDGATFSAPLLTSASKLNVALTQGAVFSAPLLTTLDHGQISVSGATSSFDAPDLGAIDDTQIAAAAGSISLPGVLSYKVDTSLCSLLGCWKIVANGSGAAVSLPNLVTLTADGGSQFLKIGAITPGAQVDLSGVTTIVTENTGTALFEADGAGSLIDLSALTTYDNGSVSFVTTSNGVIQM